MYRYTDMVELQYIRKTEYHLPYFAPGELCKVENYTEARNDRFLGWHLHHRLGINPDGSQGKTKDELIYEDRYYQRPAEELQFLRVREHRKLHRGHQNQDRQISVSDETRRRQSEAKLETNNTENRYKAVKALVDEGKALCFRDYAFYRRYCHRNGIPFGGVHVDKSGNVKGVDVPRKVKERAVGRSDRQRARYNAILSRLIVDKRLHKRDVLFLRRYCAYNEIQMPDVVMAWTGAGYPYVLEFTK